jgi:iron complex outermembrane receptor protein
MQCLRQFACLTLAAAMTAYASRAAAQDRSDENAVTQAEDAFGFSVGRESLGIYNSGNARGFSPTAAGNVRIGGLYFDPAYGLQSTLVDSTSIKVGLSAQGYPFAAPSGIVDQTLRRPASKAGASVLVSGDDFGSGSIEIDGSLPLTGNLAVRYGAVGSHVEFPDGTDNWNHSESLIARWRPAAGIEIASFWALTNDYNDEAGTFYIPAGPYLPKLPEQRHFEGPRWSDFRHTDTNTGVLASAALGKNTLLRIGAFRSVNNQKHAFSNLLLDEQPDGTGERITIADPPAKNRSLSGEARLTHSIADGPRLHLIHLSVRKRDARRQFGGSEVFDFGIGRIGEKVQAPEPDFQFGEISKDRVRQLTYGAAYDGRWKDVGEISFGISRAHFRKVTAIPDIAVARSRSDPLLYNGTAAINLSPSVILFGGYSRGLEESGTAPPNAANRNQPLPVILTQQKDAGIRFNIGKGLKAVIGAFDLSRPYFGFDSANVFKKVGTIRNKGAEFSISGALTPRVDVVAGGVFLRPRVTRDADVVGEIGKRPVGLSDHLLIANVNWRTTLLEGLELDLAVSQRGKTPTTTDNRVLRPARTVLNVGSHYHFKLAGRSATLRLQATNLFDEIGYDIPGSGIYGSMPGRQVLGYLTVDL